MSFDKLTDKQALIPLMGKLIKELSAIINNELKSQNINLSKEQAIVLKELSVQDGRPQNDLALITSRDKTSLTRLLMTMESKKLIVRRQATGDKRINLVYITKKGHYEFERTRPIILNIINQALLGVDEKRIEETKSLLKDIYGNLKLYNEE